jgi:hypothetical protein
MVDRHVDALRSFATATFDRGPAMAAFVALLLPFMFAPLLLPPALARRRVFSSEGLAERFLGWLAILERRDPLAHRRAA